MAYSPWFKQLLSIQVPVHVDLLILMIEVNLKHVIKKSVLQLGIFPQGLSSLESFLIGWCKGSDRPDRFSGDRNYRLSSSVWGKVIFIVPESMVTNLYPSLDKVRLDSRLESVELSLEHNRTTANAWIDIMILMGSLSHLLGLSSKARVVLIIIQMISWIKWVINLHVLYFNNPSIDTLHLIIRIA